jgi:predicted  nucleic acid-binding Zn-ribbon protein
VATEGERIATTEQAVRDIRDDIQAWSREQERTRQRLHDIEATVRGLALASKIAEDATKQRQRSLELRLQALTVVIAAAAIAEPFLYHLAHN